LENFDFSWKEIISNLLHLENDPNLMIKSMLREIKRRSSFKARVNIRKHDNIFYYKINNQKQMSIIHYLDKIKI